MLAGIGIYGVLAYLVTQRRREIGIRIALGSTAAGVVRLILTDGMRLTAGGLLAGLIGFATLNKTISSQVYGIGVLDPEVNCSRRRAPRHNRPDGLPDAGPKSRKGQSRHRSQRITTHVTRAFHALNGT